MGCVLIWTEASVSSSSLLTERGTVWGTILASLLVAPTQVAERAQLTAPPYMLVQVEELQQLLLKLEPLAYNSELHWAVLRHTRQG